MLNKSGKSGHPFLITDLRENALIFSPLSMILAVVLLYYGLYYVEICSLYAHFLESVFFVLNHKWVMNVVKSFLCIFWDDYIVFILQFVVYHTD